MPANRAATPGSARQADAEVRPVGQADAEVRPARQAAADERPARVFDLTCKLVVC